MKRLTKSICGYAHGAEGRSEERLTGAYCRGEFEATAIVERLFSIEEILGEDYDLERLKVLVNHRMSMREEVQERFSITKGIPVERLREIVRAEKENRIIIKSYGSCQMCVHYPSNGETIGRCEKGKLLQWYITRGCNEYMKKEVE